MPAADGPASKLKTFDVAAGVQAKASREEAKRGRMAVLSSDGRLVAARGCVHMQTAPRALLRRHTSFPGHPRLPHPPSPCRSQPLPRCPTVSPSRLTQPCCPSAPEWRPQDADGSLVAIRNSWMAQEAESASRRSRIWHRVCYRH